MLKDITLGQYIPGESLLHRADPRIKILLTIIYMAIVFLVTSLYGYAVVILFTLAVILSCRIPLKYTLKGLKPVLYLVLFTTVINLFVINGQVLVQFWIFKITYEGIILSAKIGVRVLLIVIGGSLLTLTTTPIALTDGIEKLLKPLEKIGVPAHEMAMMMSIALRFIPTILDETEKIIKAQSARGADFGSGNIVQKAKSFIPILVPLFVSAFRRADELATAMEARCYRGGKGRTRMKQLKLGLQDAVAMMILIGFGGGLLTLQFFKIL
jgi:energy-coupling factor transport system permease protein